VLCWSDSAQWYLLRCLSASRARPLLSIARAPALSVVRVALHWSRARDAAPSVEHPYMLHRCARTHTRRARLARGATAIQQTTQLASHTAYGTSLDFSLRPPQNARKHALCSSPLNTARRSDFTPTRAHFSQAVAEHEGEPPLVLSGNSPFLLHFLRCLAAGCDWSPQDTLQGGGG